MKGEPVGGTDEDRELLECVAQEIAGRAECLAAYSGGLDSTVLLHLLVRLRRERSLTLRAAYVHHGLNPRADDWAEHCRRQCLRWQVPFACLPVAVDARQGGTEAAAREARYQALAHHVRPEETLLIAQHLDDQAESFLLALKRGSGPAGLSAMASVSRLNGNRLLRPLLSFSRRRLEEYALRHRLRWIEDDSNQDARYERNFLRLEVLPLLKRRWPHILTAVDRSARLCAEQEQLLDELLSASLRGMIRPDGALAIAPLLPLVPAHRFALLRRWLAERGARMPSRDGLRRLWDEVAVSRPDAEPCLRFGDVQVRRFRQHLYLLPAMASLREYALPWRPQEGPLTLPDGLGWLRLAEDGTPVRAPLPEERVSVRFQAAGVIHTTTRRGGRSLKKLWQELAVPPWWRDRTPLLFYDELLVAAIGRFVTREGAAGEAEDVWNIAWERPEDGAPDI